MKKTLLWLSLIPFTKVQVSAAVTCGIQTAFRDGDSSQECAADAYLSVFAECQRADPDLGNLNAVVCSCNAARDAEEASAVAASNACAASCNYQECLPGCFTDLKLARAGHSNRYCNCLGAAACGKPSMSSPSTTPTELVSSTVSTETSTPASAVPPINPTPAPSSPPKCTAPYTPGSCPSVTNKGSKKCIDQHQRAMQSPGEISTNGCGPEARDFLDVLLQASLLLFATEFRRACNKHDICFGTCSLGNDQHFDQCNSVFRKDMLDTCTFYAPLALQNGLYERCLARAEIVYLAVQYQGCGPYAKAQDAACQCVNRDKNGETSSNPLEIYLPSDVVRIACGPAMDIGRDWPSFVDAVNAASSTANAEDKAALAFYASTIGIDSASVSPQITTFSRGCGSTNRRRWMSSGNKRQVVPSSRLVLFFKSFVSTDAADYGCGTSSDQQLCEVANALLGIAAVARRIDNYAGGSSTAISSGTSMLPATSMMSSDMDSSSLEPSATSRTIPNTDRSSEFGSSTASTITQPSAPSSSMSLTVSTMTSDVVQNGSHTAPLASPSSLSKYRTGDMPPEASRVTITASSVPTETTSPCVLIKHFGDSPDTPDSPDGEPEATEIPDFPGGYYYLCADGSIPPLSILPGFSVPASSGTAAPSSTAPIATAPPANVSQPSCKMTRFKGDSPDTPDTPDSPGDQPEVPELPEISQDPSNPGYYWMCV